MHIERIRVCDFRNLAQLDWELCPHTNLIYGENAQGKTNLLEAIWLFTGAKSFRGAKDSQMLRFGQNFARLSLDFFAGDRRQTAEIRIETRRSATLNEIALKSPAELAGALCGVVFSPVHLSLIKNGPQERRKFLDTSICQMKPKYISMLSEYTRVLEQRNRLLRDGPFAYGYSELMDVWDARLAAYAAVLLKTRASYVKRLLPYASEIYRGLSGGREVFSFSYVSSMALNSESTISELEKEAAAFLARSRHEEERAKMSLYGPHRDDLELYLGGKSARQFGSQGQQRSCVLALKLAECELIRETVGEYPVVLLDDVMSELDASRRAYLLNHLKGRQLIITCCDKAYFEEEDFSESPSLERVTARMEGGKLAEVLRRAESGA